jgi:hypothetical protein
MPTILAGQLFTARTWMATYEPWLLDFLHDPEKALAEDTRRAHAIALTLGHRWSPSGEYPRAVWGVVYP